MDEVPVRNFQWVIAIEHGTEVGTVLAVDVIVIVFLFLMVTEATF